MYNIEYDKTLYDKRGKLKESIPVNVLQMIKEKNRARCTSNIFSRISHWQIERFLQIKDRSVSCNLQH